MTEEQKGSEVLITYVHPTLVSEYRRFGYGGLPLQGFEKLRVTGIKVRLTLTLTLALTLTLRLHRHRSPLTAHLSPFTLTLTKEHGSDQGAHHEARLLEEHDSDSKHGDSKHGPKWEAKFGEHQRKWEATKRLSQKRAECWGKNLKEGKCTEEEPEGAAKEAAKERLDRERAHARAQP